MTPSFWRVTQPGLWAVGRLLQELDLGLPVTPPVAPPADVARFCWASGPSSLKPQPGGWSDTLHLITKGHESCQERYSSSTKKDLSLLSLRSCSSLCGDGAYMAMLCTFCYEAKTAPKNEINFLKKIF